MKTLKMICVLIAVVFVLPAMAHPNKRYINAKQRFRNGLQSSADMDLSGADADVNVSGATGDVRVSGGGDVIVSSTGDVDVAGSGSYKIGGYVLHKCDNVTIATAAVKTLNATPVLLVAAPGADKFVVVQTITVALDYASAGYDDVGAGEDLSFQYVGGSVKVSQDIDSASFLGETSDQVRFIAGTPLQLAGTADAAGFTPTVNAGIDVTILSAEIYSAAGDSPLKFEICYAIKPDLLD